MTSQIVLSQKLHAGRILHRQECNVETSSEQTWRMVVDGKSGLSCLETVVLLRKLGEMRISERLTHLQQAWGVVHHFVVKNIQLNECTIARI